MLLLFLTTLPDAPAGETERSLDAARDARDDAARPIPDGSLERYVALALAQHPALEAAFERWAASVNRIASARKLPEPSVSFGLFLRAIETRAGPQRARLGLQQSFPWPTRLTAGADAAGQAARAAQRRVDAQALEVAERVLLAYWALWELRATRHHHHEHLALLRDLSATVRGRLEVGQATLADLQQIDLDVARVEDQIRSMDAREPAAAAALQAAVGHGHGAAADWPTTTPPPEATLPTADDAAIAAAALDHPLLSAIDAAADASDAQARAAGAARMPGFTVGVDWIDVGEPISPNDVGGKDAISVGLGVQLPLWQRTYAREVAAARADADALRADGRAAAHRQQAEVLASLAELRDSHRRVHFLRDTLLPQLDGARRSLLGSYASGAGSVRDALLAQRDRLDLNVELEQERARHARAWATLERQVGAPLAERASTPIEPGGSDDG